jgi:osmoprotectant transport system permease protein
LLKKKLLEIYPEVEGILNQLADKIRDDGMRRINYEVAVEKKDAACVAKAFLEENNLLRAADK